MLTNVTKDGLERIVNARNQGLTSSRVDSAMDMTCVLQDFVSAVMDVDYSPTGREFVAGSYDRSVRIFAYQGGHSREVLAQMTVVD
jgi:WD40 repeat protein